MGDSLYVNDNGTPVPLNLGTGIEFVERIEALEAGVAAQATKDSQQDAAINAAANASLTSAIIDGLDLVLTYGDGSTKRVQLPAGKSVGDLWMGFDPASKPANVQLYAGQLLSRASYEAHSAFVLGGNRTVLSESEWQAQVTANGFCPYYSSGDGSTTYRMPLIKGVHPEFVAALAEAGRYIEAGLPDASGSLETRAYGSTYSPNLGDEGVVSGMVSYVKNGGVTSVSTTYDAADSKSYQMDRYDLSLSASNSIYGNSSTVQPPSVTCVLGEYVVGSVAVIGEADAASLLAGQTLLEGRVGALENGIGKSAAYVVASWRSGTDWYDRYSDGRVVQGGLYKHGAALAAGGTAAKAVTFPCEMASTDYNVDVTAGYISAGTAGGIEESYNSKKTTGMTISVYNRNSSTKLPTDLEISWTVSGKAK